MNTTRKRRTNGFDSALPLGTAQARHGLDGREERRARLGITEAPMGYVDGMSLYEYVGTNPARFLDPEGLAAVDAGVEDVDDPTKLKSGALGETEWLREGHIWVNVACKKDQGKWIVSSVDDRYVVGTRIATVDLIILMQKFDPNNDRAKAQKLRASVERYEGNIRKALVGNWNGVAKDMTPTISKLTADTKEDLVKKVDAEIDGWLEDVALGAAGMYKADAAAAGYRPPTKEFLLGRLKAKIDIRIEEEGATTRPTTQPTR